MKTARLAGLTAALLAGIAAFAADPADESGNHTIQLRNGKVLEDACILDKKPNGVVLANKDECIFVRFSDMPLEYQRKFGYVATKSARYENKLAERKKVIEIEEAERKAREKQRKANEDKHYKDKHVNAQRQTISKLEHQLEEAKKNLKTMENTVSQVGEELGMSTIGSSRVCIESPWGYGGRIRSGEHNAAVTSKLMKEAADAPDPKRDKQVQDVVDLQLRLEAAQIALDEMLMNQSRGSSFFDFDMD